MCIHPKYYQNTGILYHYTLNSFSSVPARLALDIWVIECLLLVNIIPLDVYWNPYTWILRSCNDYNRIGIYYSLANAFNNSIFVHFFFYDINHSRLSIPLMSAYNNGYYIRKYNSSVLIYANYQLKYSSNSTSSTSNSLGCLIMSMILLACAEKYYIA